MGIKKGILTLSATSYMLLNKDVLTQSRSFLVPIAFKCTLQELPIKFIFRESVWKVILIYLHLLVLAGIKMKVGTLL